MEEEGKENTILTCKEKYFLLGLQQNKKLNTSCTDLYYAGISCAAIIFIFLAIFIQKVYFKKFKSSSFNCHDILLELHIREYTRRDKINLYHTLKY